MEVNQNCEKLATNVKVQNNPLQTLLENDVILKNEEVLLIQEDK